jgi:hypothetical protein
LFRANGIIYWKERGTWHKRRFSDIDMDDMIELARIINREIYLLAGRDIRFDHFGWIDDAVELALRHETKL